MAFEAIGSIIDENPDREGYESRRRTTTTTSSSIPAHLQCGFAKNHSWSSAMTSTREWMCSSQSRSNTAREAIIPSEIL